MGTLTAIAIGVDIGQKRDPTAIAVVEQRYRYVGGKRREHYIVRFLERLPLGTSYPDIAARLKEIVSNRRLEGDATEVKACAAYRATTGRDDGGTKAPKTRATCTTCTRR